MTKSELLNKAVYIQYPLKYGVYNTYNIDEINKLPLPEKGMMHDGWACNNNHFTSKYHIQYSIPLLCKLLNIAFNKNDFELLDIKSGDHDISILAPKNECKYEIYGYTRGEHIDNICFKDIITNTSKEKGITDYHKLYKYSHECSRLINKTINSCRKLFISGDSQMIPDISFLSCFFKEIWYFDNRKKLILSDKWENETFTDVLIEVNHLPINEYINVNFM